MNYHQGQESLENWIVAETDFKQKFQGKCEVIFGLGNGYLGIRSSTEESYLGQTRNMFVSGTFNKCNANEVTELPNVADVIRIDFFINNEILNLEKGTFSNYNRSLNLKNGILTREFVWTSILGEKFSFCFKRFVSFDNLHTICSKISITPLNCNANILIKSGINGQVTNSGAQHFEEGEKRIFDKEYLQMLQVTCESDIVFIHNTFHDFKNSDVKVSSRFEIDRRKVLMIYEGNTLEGKTFEFSKISNVYTSRDKETSHLSLDELRKFSIEDLKTQSKKGFDVLLSESEKKWSKYWQLMDIEINSDNAFDQLAIRFSQYHLLIMAPKHDSRYGIGAKGLLGEGYKGHSFWDTELFILPFFTYTFPGIARSLLEYRYKTIEGARKKAFDNGYKGAMYPWESAWADDGEVTPVWGAADIITGKATKIWSGFIEQHITSDIAFAVWQYFMVTKDEDFMRQYGYEILLDTGIFWSSRLEWNEKQQLYHINNIIGPDEYKEHINNDAFTNYMAKWCMENAIHYYTLLKEKEPSIFDKLNKKLNLDEEILELKEKYNKVYLPIPNKESVIPQDDTYLQKKQIDLSNYKNQSHVGSIFKDYNLNQVNEIQVSKQASVVMLIYLLEHKFNNGIKKANYNYYEPKTLHDSSLSLSTHAILASDLGDVELAYDLFQKASIIDLGSDMETSNHGIHAASHGGVWQIVVCGFGGVRMIDGTLRINPKLPDNINSITYPITWASNKLKVQVDKNTINIINFGDKPISLQVYGNEYSVENEIKINY